MPPPSLPLPPRLVKFNRVNVLTIFIESNQGDEDTTVVQKLALFGSGAPPPPPLLRHCAWEARLTSHAPGCCWIGRSISFRRQLSAAELATQSPACAAGDSFNVAEIKDVSKEEK